MDKDFSRLAIEQTERTIGKLQEGLKGRMPYGPRSVVKTNLEQRLEMQELDPRVKHSIAQEMGTEQWDAYMKEMYK